MPAPGSGVNVSLQPHPHVLPHPIEGDGLQVGLTSKLKIVPGMVVVEGAITSFTNLKVEENFLKGNKQPFSNQIPLFNKVQIITN